MALCCASLPGSDPTEMTEDFVRSAPLHHEIFISPAFACFKMSFNKNWYKRDKDGNVAEGPFNADARDPGDRTPQVFQQQSSTQTLKLQPNALVQEFIQAHFGRETKTSPHAPHWKVDNWHSGTLSGLTYLKSSDSFEKMASRESTAHPYDSEFLVTEGMIWRNVPFPWKTEAKWPTATVPIPSPKDHTAVRGLDVFHMHAHDPIMSTWKLANFGINVQLHQDKQYGNRRGAWPLAALWEVMFYEKGTRAKGKEKAKQIFARSDLGLQPADFTTRLPPEDVVEGVSLKRSTYVLHVLFVIGDSQSSQSMDPHGRPIYKFEFDLKSIHKNITSGQPQGGTLVNARSSIQLLEKATSLRLSPFEVMTIIAQSIISRTIDTPLANSWHLHWSPPRAALGSSSIHTSEPPTYDAPPDYHLQGTLVVSGAEKLVEHDFEHVESLGTSEYERHEIRRMIKTVQYRLPLPIVSESYTKTIDGTDYKFGFDSTRSKEEKLCIWPVRVLRPARHPASGSRAKDHGHHSEARVPEDWVNIAYIKFV